MTNKLIFNEKCDHKKSVFVKQFRCVVSWLNYFLPGHKTVTRDTCQMLIVYISTSYPFDDLLSVFLGTTTT